MTVYGPGAPKYGRGGRPLRRTPRDEPLTNWIAEDRGYETPCWIWQGKPASANGYGRLRIGNGRRVFAPRYFYEHFRGPIPEGLTPDHLCCVSLCVNPHHLKLVTPTENNRRRRWNRLTAESAAEIRAFRDDYFKRHPLNAKGQPRQRFAQGVLDEARRTLQVLEADDHPRPPGPHMGLERKRQLQRGKPLRARPRSKGNRAELEIITLLQAWGWSAARRNWMSGGQGGGDILNGPVDVHVEVKHRERVAIWEWIAQAEAEARPTDLPAVLFRRNRSRWYAAIPLTDLLELLKQREENDGDSTDGGPEEGE